MTFDLMT